MCGKLQFSVFVVIVCGLSHAVQEVSSEKYRVCTVDGRGVFKKAAVYCPTLDSPDSEVECVVGVDRLDCLRRISKGKADFTLLTAEDLLAALNLRVDVLVTNELRFSMDPYEYQLVAVVDKFANISNIYDIQGKRLCHPGYGHKSELTKVLGNFFEATNVAPSCDTTLSLTENRIKASSKFFKSACKAGPWVSEPDLDYFLKSKYPNMCELCGNPWRCTTDDKYWGRRGSLFCLTDGVGDIAWSRLDDVHSQFGITPGAQPSGVIPENYNILCRDGTLMPINTTNPCVWVGSPWPVIAAKRTSASKVQSFVSSLSRRDSLSPWKEALLNLIEIYHYDIVNVNPLASVDSYLSKIPGYLSANSFTSCHPPRTVRLCTVSNIETAKCHWLREAAAVYGLEPDIDCVRSDNKTHCMQAVNENYADAVIITPDQLTEATREYNLKTILYEVAKADYLYNTVAVVKATTDMANIEDLFGKSVCFPSYNGIAWNTAIYELKKHKLLSSCSYNKAMSEFFTSACVPGITNSSENMKSLCKDKLYDGETGAFRCLAEGVADVAFFDYNTIQNYTDGASQEKWAEKLKFTDFRILCFTNNGVKECGLSSMSYRQIMVRSTLTPMQEQETLNTLIQLDNYFGRKTKAVMPAFSLYGPYDGQSNILFSNGTETLSQHTYFKLSGMETEDMLAVNYSMVLQNLKICTETKSSANMLQSNVLILIWFYFICLYKHE